MVFVLPQLPFAPAALAARGMCQETLELHHDKHHRAYVTALNELVNNESVFKDKTLDQLLRLSRGDRELSAVFNNAGQHWNHSFFWNCLSPVGGGIPGLLGRKLDSDFGSVDKFKAAFKAAAVGQFGSGWAWLVLAPDGRLKVTKTASAELPLVTGEGKALLVLDVWEHAYYLDFRNRRPEFTDNFLGRLANYEYAAEQLMMA